jgi:WD40 repeat protein
MREPIHLENASHLNPIAQVRSGWITQVIWSPDGTTLAIAGGTGVHLYAGSFGAEPTHRLEAHEGPVKGLAFGLGYGAHDQDRLLLATCGADTTIRLWDASRIDQAVTPLGVLAEHRGAVEGVAFGSDRQHRPLLASCGADGTICLWDVDKQVLKAERRGHEKEVASVTFAMSGHVFASASWDCTVRIWDSQSEAESLVIGEHNDWVRQVRANPPGTMLASAGKDGLVKLWDALSTELYAQIEAHPGGVDCVAFSPDGALLATGGRDHHIRVWDVERILQHGPQARSAPVVELAGHDKPVLTLDFNPAGTLLASGSGDNTVKLWAASDD